MEKQLGLLDVQQLVAAFLGSVVGVSRQSHKSVMNLLMAIVGGTASSAYLTPIVADIVSIRDARYMLGLAFFLGTLGMRSVELVGERLESTLKAKNGNGN